LFVSAQPLLGEVVPNPTGFQQDLFDLRILAAKMPDDRSPISKTFGFPIEADSIAIVE
jgi:hypothetical protein